MRRLILGALAGLVAMSATPDAANAPQANGQIVFARFDPLVDDTVLYTVNPDGSHERQVLPLPVECPRWSPDGTRIVTCGLPPNGATTIINPDDGSYRTLPMADPDHLFTACPLMSPDGSRLACGSFGEDRYDGPISDPTARGCFNPRWSPDGTKVVFGIFTTAAGRSIYTVNADGTGLTQDSVRLGGSDRQAKPSFLVGWHRRAATVGSNA
jgi:hypothetical protein